MLDKNDVRGFLKVGAIVCVTVGVGLFVSAFGDRAGMKKDKASGRVYHVQATGMDSSLFPWAFAALATGAVLAGLTAWRPIWK